jgi:hypothetical protein
MRLPDVQESADAQTLLDDIFAYVVAAETHLKTGQVQSLAGLDAVVAALCARLTALPVGSASSFMAQVETLMARLDSLQESMRTARDAVASDLKSMGLQKKATKAYQNHNKPVEGSGC